jgi:hypothetical protein
MYDLISRIRKTTVFLGNLTQKKEPDFNATGFLLLIQGVYHLATAKHIVMDSATGKFIDREMRVFFNLKNGRIGSRRLEKTKRDFGVNWIFHENDEVDIAIIPILLEEEKDDVLTIPDDMFLSIDELFEVCDIFFLSYQPGVQPQKRISPIIRSGTISLINEDKTFYIDASAFPGNSGSPVFLKPLPIRFGRKGDVAQAPVSTGDIALGPDPLGGRFIGIVGGYIPYQEIAISTQTRRPRIIFEENTGLSKVWPIDFIREILESKVFKQQLARVRLLSPDNN